MCGASPPAPSKPPAPEQSPVTPDSYADIMARRQFYAAQGVKSSNKTGGLNPPATAKAKLGE